MEQRADGPLRLAWQPEMADLLEAFRARNRSRKVEYKIALLALAGLAAALAGWLLRVDVLVPAGLGAVVAALFVYFVAVPLSTRSLWRSNPALRAPLVADVDPVRGITLTGQSTGHHPWATVHSVLETDRVFVVQLSGYRRLGFLLLAKRGLPSGRHVEDLRRLLSGSRPSPNP